VLGIWASEKSNRHSNPNKPEMVANPTMGKLHGKVAAFSGVPIDVGSAMSAVSCGYPALNLLDEMKNQTYL
jgi:hypothetical protein